MKKYLLAQSQQLRIAVPASLVDYLISVRPAEACQICEWPTLVLVMELQHTAQHKKRDLHQRQLI